MAFAQRKSRSQIRSEASSQELDDIITFRIERSRDEGRETLKWLVENEFPYQTITDSAIFHYHLYWDLPWINHFSQDGFYDLYSRQSKAGKEAKKTLKK